MEAEMQDVNNRTLMDMNPTWRIWQIWKFTEEDNGFAALMKEEASG